MVRLYAGTSSLSFSSLSSFLSLIFFGSSGGKTPFMLNVFCSICIVSAHLVLHIIEPFVTT